MCDMTSRYYAYPVRADAVEAARRDPISVIPADPLADAWGLVPVAVGSGSFASGIGARARPIVWTMVPEMRNVDMLCLDDRWFVLSALLWRGSGRDAAPRPASALVAPGAGTRDAVCRRRTTVLDAGQVAGVAADIALLEPVTDRDPILRYAPGWTLADINHMIGRTRRFVAGVALRRMGLAYSISPAEPATRMRIAAG